MENRGPLGLVIVALLVTLLVPSSSADAYSKQTHSNITKYTFEKYQEIFNSPFSFRDIADASRGSADEDKNPRYLNHFYDPVHDQGLDTLLLNGIASPVWADSILEQGNYFWGKIHVNEPLFSSDTDYSWDRAVYEYVHGDREYAIQALGHQLHLVQDVTVPAHVRNDAHPPWNQDAYEKYSDGKVPNIQLRVGDIPISNNITETTQRLATFTNLNFLSRDSFDKYQEPKINKRFIRGEYVYNQLGHRIAFEKVDFELSTGEKVEYVSDDTDFTVAKENWEVLSRQAVLYGVSTIDLFFRDVEKEQRTGDLLAMNKSRRDTEGFLKRFAQSRDSKLKLTSLAAADVYELNKEDADGYFAAADVYGLHIPASARDSVLKDETGQTASAILSLQRAIQSPIVGERIPRGIPPAPLNGDVKEDENIPQEIYREELKDVDIEENLETTVTEAPKVKETNAEEETVNLSPFEPGGYGYGGGGSGVSEKEADDTDDTVSHDPVITYPANASILATTTISFSGTGVAGQTISAVIGTTTATSTVLSDGTWSLETLVLPEGASQGLFTQIDNDGNESNEVTVSFEIDITPPDATTMEVLECTHTLRVDGECLSGSTSINVNWEAVSSAFSYGVYVGGNEVSTTTTTSTVVSMNDQETSEILIHTYDEAGNSAVSNTVSVEVFENPIIITEVAWGGTAASTEDEWIELYNRTDYILSVGHIRIRADDGAPVVTLAGTIGKGDYWTDHAYLIERGDGTATSKAEDLAITFEQLSDSGEELILELATSTLTSELDRTPSVSSCSGWCGGTASGKFYSMERIDVDTAGSESTNWQSNDGYAVVNEYYDARGYEYGSDRKIYGTVKQESSAGYPSIGYFCEPYTSSFEEGGTYSPTVPANISTENCTYLTRLWETGSRKGVAYVGTVGSSTSITGHSLGGVKTTENGDVVESLENGDNILIAFWKSYTGSSHADDDNQFDNYFTGTGTTTPHADFRTLNWIYSE